MATQEVSQVVMDANTVTTIANNINSLYSNAINQLTSYTLGVVALVGILIPVLLTIIQWRSLKDEKKSLEKNIQEGIDNANVVIRNALIVEMEKQNLIVEKALTSRMEEKFKMVDKKIETIKATTFFLQGTSLLSSGHYSVAISDFCTASKGYINGEDELNGQRAIEALLDSCLPKINKTDFADDEVEKHINHLIEYLELPEVNVNERYSDRISKLKRESIQAKSR